MCSVSIWELDKEVAKIAQCAIVAAIVARGVAGELVIPAMLRLPGIFALDTPYRADQTGTPNSAATLRIYRSPT
jgi:hypothetical protein